MKYDINREFGIFRYLHVPLNRVILFLAKGFLSILPKGMRNTKSLSTIKKKILSHDKKKIKIYIIKPKEYEKSLPVILYLHGGGFVFKGVPYHFKEVKEYAMRLKSMVIYVDYRLSFDTPFGSSIQDCFTTYRYILDNAKELNLDVNRISLGGDSAGGYLCLLLLDLCKKEKLILPKKLFLIYPVVDPSLATPSMEKFNDTPMWNSKLNQKMWKIYSKNNPVYEPLKVDLSYLPPTYIETAEYDCLHDEGVQLSQKLIESNVYCKLHESRNTMHGYDICQKAKATRLALDSRITFLSD